MSSQNENLATDEPKTIEQAENMMLFLRDEIVRIQNQLDDPDRRSSMTEADYATWSHKATAAVRHKKRAVHHISIWCTQHKRKNGNVHSLHHITVGRSLQLVSKQYGRLVNVLTAAEAYINSPSEEADEELMQVLIRQVVLAREVVQTDAEAPELLAQAAQ